MNLYTEGGNRVPNFSMASEMLVTAGVTQGQLDHRALMQRGRSRGASRFRLICVLAVFIVGHRGSTAFAISYDETTNGQLSATYTAPTSWGTLSHGTNTLRGSVSSSDRDYVTLKIPTGHTLSSLVVGAYTGGDPTSFIGVQTGTAMTVHPDSGNPAPLSGYTHFHPTDVGLDILPAMGTGPGSMGFTPPLPANDYTFWIQQISSLQPTTYQFNFVVDFMPPVSLTGDYNDNDVVDAADYVLWRSTLNQTGTGLAADGDDDGMVDQDDYNLWRANFGNSAPAAGMSAAIPEPAGVLVAIWLMAGALWTRSSIKRSLAN